MSIRVPPLVIRYTIYMYILLFLPYYIRWHYTRAWQDFFQNWKTFVSFLYSFFSIRALLSTLFAPWRRLGEERVNNFDPESFLGFVIVNGLMRLLGFVIRLPVVLFGLFFIFSVFLLGVFLSAMWLIFPVALLFVFSLSLKGLFGI